MLRNGNKGPGPAILQQGLSVLGLRTIRLRLALYESNSALHVIIVPQNRRELRRFAKRKPEQPRDVLYQRLRGEELAKTAP